MKFLRIAFAWMFFCAPTFAQVGQIPTYVQPAPTLGSYQGPGDAVAGVVSFGSCARAFTAAYAASNGSACDLVDSAAPTTVICPLKFLTTGFVDLASASCTGGVTPAVKCAAATGGVCNISKIYDQAGGLASGWVNVTASTQLKLTFSSLNGLPGMTGTNAAASNALSTSTISQAAPYSVIAVYVRTALVANAAVVTFNANGFQMTTATANLATYKGASGNIVTVAATDSVYHAVQGVQNGASSSISADGATNTGAVTNNAISGTSIIARAPSTASLDGTIMEVGLWAGTISTSAMNSNQHGTNGYNF